MRNSREGAGRKHDFCQILVNISQAVKHETDCVETIKAMPYFLSVLKSHTKDDLRVLVAVLFSDAVHYGHLS